MNDKIPCLSIWQPWAWAIVNGHKSIENRTWETRVRGRILIHAGKYNGADDLANDCEFMASQGLTVPTDLPRGAIVGSADLLDCLPVERVAGDPWAFGPVCWKLNRPAHYAKPIPYRGAQGIFWIPREVICGVTPILPGRPEGAKP